MTTSTQLLTGTIMDAWQRMLRARCVMAGTLDAELRQVHDITLSDYDVLVQLHDAERHALRMSDLSVRTMLTRSGVTRLIDGLVRDGHVVRQACDTDARVSYAVLTASGIELVARARLTHHDGIRRVFAQHFSDDEAAELARLLGKIPGTLEAGPGPCTGGTSS